MSWLSISSIVFLSASPSENAVAPRKCPLIDVSLEGSGNAPREHKGVAAAYRVQLSEKLLNGCVCDDEARD